MATYTFYPPQVMEGYPLRDKWWRRVVSPRGVAVLIDGATVTTSRAVTEDELNEYQYVFLGGREHVVTEAVKDVLVGLGFIIKTQGEADAASDEAHNGFLVLRS
jgi:hypothetical protein